MSVPSWASIHSLRPTWMNAAFAVFLAGVAAAILFTGPVPQVQYGSDVFNFLDGAYRQYSGQVIHRDFFSPLGGVAFLPFSLAMRVTGPTVAALPLGVTLSFGGLALWAWWLAGPRLAPLAGAAFTLFLGLLGAATYVLDFGSWSSPSYAMYYNRFAWALLGLLILECYVPSLTAGRRADRLAGVSSGAVLAALLLVKFNFFVAGFGLIACAPLALRHTRDRWQALAAGFLVAATLFAFVASVDLAGYAREIAGMARTQAGSVYLEVATRIVADNRSWLVAGGIVVACLLAEARAAGPSERPAHYRATTAYVLICGAGLAVSVTNCQYGELPSFPLALLVLAALLARVTGSRLGPALALAAVILTALFALPQGGMVGRALARHVLVPAAENELRLSPPAVAELALRPWPGEPPGPDAGETLARQREVSPYAYGQWLQDGIALLDPRVSRTSRIVSLDWSNPFSFCLGLPPTPGDSIAWAYGRTVGEAWHPDPRLLAERADFIMEPKLGLQPDTIAFKRRLFAPLLQESFAVAATSRYWILWQRRAASAAPLPATN